MRILLTNDDGVLAPGMRAMAQAVAHWVATTPADEVREAVVVAPHTNYSGMSAAVGDVYDFPQVRYRRYEIPGAESLPTYGLEAAPALCAAIGALGTFGFVPDLVLSGINAGANVGRSILHSGTVGATLSAAQLGVSGLAVSVQWDQDVHFDAAAVLALELLEELGNAPRPTVLNLNVPNIPLEQIRGIQRARISTATMLEAAGPFAGGEPLCEEGVLPLQLGVATPTLGDASDEAPDEDAYVVEAGYASLTAITGPRENNNPMLDSLLQSSLRRVSARLQVR
jgi:5'-nucleotidase